MHRRDHRRRIAGARGTADLSTDARPQRQTGAHGGRACSLFGTRTPYPGYVLSEALQGYAPIKHGVEAPAELDIAKDGIQE